MQDRLPIDSNGHLCPRGYQLRNALAVGGHELTPSQLAEGLREAEIVLETKYGLNYGEYPVEVADEIERALAKRYCDWGR